MRNLLVSPPSESEIAAILARTAGRPSLPPLGDAAWTAARETPAVSAWIAPLVARAEAELAEPMPLLSDELYADFFKTGNRLPFERPYFERRRRLGRAAMAVLLGDEAERVRLIPSFLRKLGEIMDETSWTLPAHVWTEPTGKDPLTIDLFSAECANNFADLLVVFSALIPGGLARRIRNRLRTQFFENYANRQPPFHWATLPMNWNAVCHQGVLGAALAIEEDHALVARMLARAARGLPHYLTGFGADGSTSEGPGYWSYGFGWFSELNARLEHRTRGELSLFEGDGKVARIARFAPLMTLSNGHMVNFSDGGRTGRLNPALLAYLGHRLGEPLLSAQSAALYRLQSERQGDLDGLRCDFFHFTRFALRAPSPAILAVAKEPVQPDVFFEDYGAVVARGADSRGHLWEFAAKAGHNAEHHNHNDCGSFLLNIDGAPALIEIGAPEYTRGFFSDDLRYTFLAARSLGHSVPFVNGCEQRAGRDFCATVLNFHADGGRIEFAIDLTKAYPAEARCKKLHRTFVLEKDAGWLAISDLYELETPGTIEAMIITQDPIVHDGACARLRSPSLSLCITPQAHTRLARIETCDYRGHKGTDEKIWRLRYGPAAPGVQTGAFGCQITI